MSLVIDYISGQWRDLRVGEGLDVGVEERVAD